MSDTRSALDPDLFGLDGFLTEEEREVRERVREFSDAEVIPIMADCWERGEFSFQLVPKLAALDICGETIKGYGCAGLSAVGAGLAAMELARGDGSIYTFFGATSGFAINTIANLGSEAQKEKYIPGMARLEKLGAFALTEPEHGADAVMLETTARQEGGEYVIHGKKRWIGNGTVASSGPSTSMTNSEDSSSRSGRPVSRRPLSRARPPSDRAFRLTSCWRASGCL